LYALERLAELSVNKGNITFDIYGQVYSEEYWNECQKVIASLPENVSVNYKGTVDAEKVATTIQDYHALFMPTRGENFGHVILESLSAGRPVMISDQTPWHDLEEKMAGWDLSLDDESVWQQKINQFLLMEDNEFQEWSRGARKVAEEYVSSPELLEGYRRMF